MARRRDYIPINPTKYSGSYPITLKSSWEEEFARIHCDLNPLCLEWAYEAIKIPYNDPTADPVRYPKGKQTIYVPDFLMSFQGNNGRIRTALVEIKPLHETLLEHARNDKDRMAIMKNYAKWEVAIGWCRRRNGVEFVILTEAQLFGEEEKPKKAPTKRRIKKS